MRTILAMVVCALCLCALCGCDVFWDAKFTQERQANAAFVAPTQGSTDNLTVDLEKFAEKYALKCESGINARESLTCYSSSSSKVSGGFGIAQNDVVPTIDYRGAAAGGPAFFSKNAYCARVVDIKAKLEEFMGPLNMEVSHTGGPPYNDCK